MPPPIPCVAGETVWPWVFFADSDNKRKVIPEAWGCLPNAAAELSQSLQDCFLVSPQPVTLPNLSSSCWFLTALHQFTVCLSTPHQISLYFFSTYLSSSAFGFRASSMLSQRWRKRNALTESEKDSKRPTMTQQCLCPELQGKVCSASASVVGKKHTLSS